jgi:carbon monoxide dehydrogenase subunit G
VKKVTSDKFRVTGKVASHSNSKSACLPQAGNSKFKNMTTIESRIGKIEEKEETVFQFLSSFRNFENLVPQDKISDWQATEDSCRFTIPGIGEVGLKIVEKEPHKAIKYSGDNLATVNFNLWIQLKEVTDRDTRVKITFKADLNPMLNTLAKKPLQEFVNILVDKLEQHTF